eukprot:4277030-Alexandrium_andersonii.AAC.1
MLLRAAGLGLKASTTIAVAMARGSTQHAIVGGRLRLRPCFGSVWPVAISPRRLAFAPLARDLSGAKPLGARSQAGSQTGGQASWQARTQASKQAHATGDRQADRRTNRQADVQTGRQAEASRRANRLAGCTRASQWTWGKEEQRSGGRRKE